MDGASRGIGLSRFPHSPHGRILHQPNVLIGIRPTFPGRYEERYPLQILIHAVVNDQMRLRVACRRPERDRRVQLGYQFGSMNSSR